MLVCDCFLCPIRGQHLSRCFREEFTCDLDCSPRTSLARAVELPFEKSFQFFSENEPPKLWNDVLVTIWVPAQAKFQLRLGSVPIQLLPAFRDLVFLHIRFCKFTQRNTVKTRFTDTRVIRTPHYYRQFTLFLGKENPYIFSKFNPLISIAPTPLPQCPY